MNNIGEMKVIIEIEIEIEKGKHRHTSIGATLPL